MPDWLPVSTLILGSVMTFLGGLASESHRSRMARRLKREDHEVKIVEARRAFQRENLLSLQEAGSALLEATDREHDEKCRLHDEHHNWPTPAGIGAETRQARRVARHRTEILTARVTEDDLRQKLQDALACEQAVTHSESHGQANEALEAMREKFAASNEAIGSSLRSLL